MLITSHIASVLLLNEIIPLSSQELIMAWCAGVFIDIDHVFISNKWKDDVKRFFTKFETSHGEVNQHSFLQEPIIGLFFSVVLGVVISLFFMDIRWWVAPLFLGIHVVLDAVMNFEHRPFFPFSKKTYYGFVRSGTRTEFFLSLVFLFIIIFVI
jgi:hypothetical protein